MRQPINRQDEMKRLLRDLEYYNPPPKKKKKNTGKFKNISSELFIEYFKYQSTSYKYENLNSAKNT